MDFEWDEAKNKKNKDKHGVSFELAEYLFNETLVVKEDGRSDYGEVRYIGYGLYWVVV